jgi:hypothetical protein
MSLDVASIWDQAAAARRALRVAAWLTVAASYNSEQRLATRPAHWLIHDAGRLRGFTGIAGGAAKLKVVEEARWADRNEAVVVKSPLPTPRKCIIGKRGAKKVGLCSGGIQGHVLHAWGEVLFLEYLRGLPGIPELLGGYFQPSGLFSYVVRHAGTPIAELVAFKAKSPRLRPEYVTRSNPGRRCCCVSRRCI